VQITTPMSDELCSYLDLASAQLKVTAENMANASTSGYTREVSTWQENDPVYLSGNSVGQGAIMTGAASQRDRVLEQSLQQQTQLEPSSSARLTALEGVQTIFNQTLSATSDSASSGIAGGMTQLFNALAQLESSPSDNALRQQVLTAANNMVQAFQSSSSQLAQQRTSLDQQSGTVISQVNALTQSLAGLNRQIEIHSPNTDAGSLEDQRQQDLTQLSQLIGIHQIRTENNGITVTTSSGALLVANDQSYALSTGVVAGVAHFFDASGTDITTQLSSGGGQLGGVLTTRDQDIPQIGSALDTLAYSVGSQMNTANMAGSDLNGNPGTAIFNLPATATNAASTISLTITNPSAIAAAGTGLGPGDDTNLLAMVNIQNLANTNGVTPTNFYSDFVTSMGSLVSQTSTLNQAQQASLTQVQNQRNALSSVDLNEEAAALETMERSCQAASKVFTTLDSIFATSLNLGTQSAVS
jgi:flagellar hook-associated protein 1